MKFNNKFKYLLSILCLLVLLFSAVTLTGCDSEGAENNETTIVLTGVDDSKHLIENEEKTTEKETEKAIRPESIGDDNSKVVLSEIPAYSGSPYVVINDNIPSFNKYELTTKGYEAYASLDSFGRCGGAVASCGREIMPAQNEERGSISSVKPSGWIQAQYDCVSGKYLYNRCHLLGWQLSAENANKRNLITGTRYMNTEGMLPFENMVADYIRETDNHVAYRVTPIYEGNDLVASGVQMEAYSVEDNGDGICFNVFCYNVQPGVEIDYSTGSSQAVSIKEDVADEKQGIAEQYILNTNSKKIHKIHCQYVNKMSEANKKSYSGSLDDLYSQGYTTCGNCF